MNELWKSAYSTENKILNCAGGEVDYEGATRVKINEPVANFTE